MLTWVPWSSCPCTRGCAFVQAHSLPSCTYMGTVAGHMHTHAGLTRFRDCTGPRDWRAASAVLMVWLRLHEVCAVEEFSGVLVCLTRVCAHTSEGHCIAEQLLTNRTQHNDVLKGIFRFPWESGSFRGGQAPTGAWGHGLGQLWQRLGPCAVLGGPVLAKSVFPVEGSLQAEQGKQDRRPGAALEMHSPNLEGLRGSHPLSWAGQQRGVRTALEPPDWPPSQFCRVLQGVGVLQLGPCPTGDSVQQPRALAGWAASLPSGASVCILPRDWAFTSLM